MLSDFNSLRRIPRRYPDQVSWSDSPVIPNACRLSLSVTHQRLSASPAAHRGRSAHAHTFISPAPRLSGHEFQSLSVSPSPLRYAGAGLSGCARSRSAALASPPLSHARLPNVAVSDGHKSIQGGVGGIRGPIRGSAGQRPDFQQRRCLVRAVLRNFNRQLAMHAQDQPAVDVRFARRAVGRDHREHHHVGARTLDRRVAAQCVAQTFPLQPRRRSPTASPTRRPWQ